MRQLICYFLGINLDLDPAFIDTILMQADDIERPLVTEDLGVVESHNSESLASYSIERTGHQNHGNLSSSCSSDLSHKQSQSTAPELTHSNRCQIFPLMFLHYMLSTILWENEFLSDSRSR